MNCYLVWKEKKNSKRNIEYYHKIIRGQLFTQQDFFKKKYLHSLNNESTLVTDRINTMKILFSQLTMLDHKIEENKRAELLLQSLSNLYDQFIINLTNNNQTDNLVFDDVASFELN